MKHLIQQQLSLMGANNGLIGYLRQLTAFLNLGALRSSSGERQSFFSVQFDAAPLPLAPRALPNADHAGSYRPRSISI
jgi:hypothetical protein